MKKFLRSSVLLLLKILAKIKLKRMGAKIIGVTGSAGKTSLKEAIAFILEKKYKVKKTTKSYNTEFGFPLDILNQKSPYGSKFGWFLVIVSCFKDAFFNKETFDYYVAEMGVDSPGDMDYLLSIVKPYASVILNITLAHTEYFPGGFKQYSIEKKKLAYGNDADGFVVVPYASHETRELLNLPGVKVVSFGTELESSYRILNPESTLNGISFILCVGDKKLKIHNISILGMEYVDTLAAAAVVACELEAGLDTISSRLAKFKLPPGRLNLIKGIKNTVIIDSSYNASGQPTIHALNTLKLFSQHKIACLGDMRELGPVEKKEHEAVAEAAVEVADALVLVGPLTRKYIKPKAIELGFPENKIHHFLSSEKAGKFVAENLIRGGEVILVKGSQNTILMERLVYELMEEKDKSGELLCRQDEYWDQVRSITP